MSRRFLVADVTFFVLGATADSLALACTSELTDGTNSSRSLNSSWSAFTPSEAMMAARNKTRKMVVIRLPGFFPLL